jgi:hypothetical protein
MRLKEYRNHPSKYSFEKTVVEEIDINDPLQIPVRVTNGKVILASINGIGIEKANKMFEECGTAAWAIDNLCSLDTNVEKSAGIGFGLTMKARRQLGLKLEEKSYETLEVVSKDLDEKMRKYLVKKKLIEGDLK